MKRLLLLFLLTCSTAWALPPRNEVPSPQVWIDGSALETKVGPIVLVSGTIPVFIDGLSYWPPDFYEGGTKGKRVVVRGQMVERFDLPVYEAIPGEEPRVGIPVPPGTDMRQASRRFLMVFAEWDLWSIPSDPFRGMKIVQYRLDDGDLRGPLAAPDKTIAVLLVPESTNIKKLSDLLKDLGKRGYGVIKLEFEPKKKTVE